VLPPLTFALFPAALVPAAQAGMVGEVLPGTPRVALLLCAAGSDCVEEARWYADQPASMAAPTLFFAEALADPGDVWAKVLASRDTFDKALAAANEAVRSRRDALATLQSAEAALAEVTGVVPQQALFDLAYLHGADSLRQGRGDHRLWFAKAAAIAWNRSVTLPVEESDVTTAWKAGQHAVLHMQRTSLHLLPAPENAVWAINGVELGSGEIEVQIFPGTHRLTTAVPGRARVWVATLEAQAGQGVTAAANFPPEMGVDALHAAVGASFAGEPLSADAAATLSAWCGQRGIRELSLVWVAHGPDRLCHIDLRVANAGGGFVDVGAERPLRVVADAGSCGP
jgi:hypothetical protein